MFVSCISICKLNRWGRITCFQLMASINGLWRLNNKTDLIGEENESWC